MRLPGVASFRILFFGLILNVALAPLSVTAALVGQLQLTDGKNYSGEIRLRDGGFQVLDPEAGTNLVDLPMVARLQCESIPEDVWRRRTETSHGLAAMYFDDFGFSGQSVRRVDPEINFQWGAGEPVAGVGFSEYSARWLGEVEAPVTGQFIFYVRSDDHRRLWVGDKLLIDQWQIQATSEGQGEIELVAGRRYPLKLEYAQRAGDASMQLSWSGPELPKQVVPARFLWPGGANPSPPAPGRGLSAAYFNGPELAGQPRLRIDPRIDFDWGDSAPIDGLDADAFSVRWLGILRTTTSEPYGFHLQSDDGVRLWIDDALIIDAWGKGERNAKSKLMRMDKTKEYRLRVEYLETSAQARAKLSWFSPSIPECVVPSDRLSPASVDETRKLLADAGTGLNSGVVLGQGTIVAREVHSADDSSVRFSSSPKEPALSTVNVARIILQTLSRSALDKLEPERTGLLLQNNDFIDGAFQSLDRDRVKVSSVLFGLRSFDRSRVRAILLRPVETPPVQYEVKSRDGSFYRADQFIVQPGGVSFGDSYLIGLKIAAGDLVEVAHRP